MSIPDAALRLLQAQQRSWERGELHEPLNVLELLDVAALRIYGEHNFTAINEIQASTIPMKRLKILATSVMDLSVDAIIYYDLDLHICRHIVRTYNDKDLAPKLVQEFMLWYIDILYGMVMRISQSGIKDRFQQYSLKEGLMRAIVWFYFTFDALHVDSLGKTIYVIHTILTHLPVQYRLEEIINLNLLRHVLLGRAQKCSIVRMINACGIIGHLSTDVMSYELTSAAMTYCLTGTRHPLPRETTESRMLMDAYLAVFFGTQYNSFYARYLGAAAVSILAETNRDIFSVSIVQTYLTKDSSISWLHSSPPGTSLLQDIFYLRNFKGLRDFQEGTDAAEGRGGQHKFTAIGLIRCYMELRKNQYTSVFFNAFLKSLLFGDYANVHKYHLLSAGVIKYFFYALSEYFASPIAKSLNDTLNGVKEYNFMAPLRAGTSSRPWLARKVASIGVPPSAAAAIMYVFQEVSTSTHIITSHSIFLKLILRFFLVQSSLESVTKFSIAYLLSPTELSLMRFDPPKNYDTFGCGEHPLTSKGFLSTLIDLFVYLPITDTRRQWLYIIITCLIRGALPHEKVYFRRYKLYKYVMQVLRIYRSWLDLSIPDFEKEIISALDIMGALLHQNTKLIRNSLDANSEDAQTLLDSLTHSIGTSASCLRSCVYTVAEVIEEHRQALQCNRSGMLGVDLYTPSSSTFMTGVRMNVESKFLNTIAANWTNIISFLLTLKVEAIRHQTIPIVTVALTMLAMAMGSSPLAVPSPEKNRMPQLLRAALLTPILHLKLKRKELEEGFPISGSVADAFRDRGVRLSRSKVLHILGEYYKKYVDPAFTDLTQDELEECYKKYSAYSTPIQIPSHMSRAGAFQMHFPWHNIVDYIAELSLRSYSCAVHLKGTEKNCCSHVLMEAQTMDNIMYSYPCPDIISVYHIMRIWLMTSTVKTDKSRYRAQGSGINLPELRVLCQDVIEELREIIREIYGTDTLKRVVSTEGVARPILVGVEM